MDEYILNYINERKKIKSYIRDIYSNNKPLCNSLIAAYEVGVPFEIIRGNDSEINLKSYSKRIISEYGLIDEVAYEAIKEWVKLLSSEIRYYWYCVKEGAVYELNPEESCYLTVIIDRYNEIGLDFEFIYILHSFDVSVHKFINSLLKELSGNGREYIYDKYGFNNHHILSAKELQKKYGKYCFLKYEVDNEQIETKKFFQKLDKYLEDYSYYIYGLPFKEYCSYSDLEEYEDCGDYLDMKFMKKFMDNNLFKYMLKNKIYNLDEFKNNEEKLKQTLAGSDYQIPLASAFSKKLIFFKCEKRLFENSFTVSELKELLINQDDWLKIRLKSVLRLYYG